MPQPEYLESDQTETLSNTNLYDLCYHLMKLYCQGNYSLEVILNPETHTKNIFDYKIRYLFLFVYVKFLT